MRERGHRHEPHETALQVAHVAAHAIGDQQDDVVREPQAAGFLLAAVAQDGDARLEIGLLRVGDQALVEARDQPLLEARDVLRRLVGGDHDLLVRVAQRVERVEELLLRALLAGEELDVVHEQHVDGAIAVPERERLAVLDGPDHLVREPLGGDVEHARLGLQALHLVAHGVQDVRLAEARVAVDEERVVDLAGPLRDRHRGRVREPVAGADDERLEREPGAELALEPLARARVGGGGRRGGPGRRERLARDGRQGQGLARGETDLRAIPEHLTERLAQGGEVVFVDPVHEERVGNLEVHRLRPELTRHDGAEPGVERLAARESIPHLEEDLFPDDCDLVRGNRQDSHFQRPC